MLRQREPLEVTTVAVMRDGELASHELEEEFGELEEEAMYEEELGELGEFEEEGEEEQFLGAIGNIVGSLLGEGEEEAEEEFGEFEEEAMYEEELGELGMHEFGEVESGEAFFGGL